MNWCGQDAKGNISANQRCSMQGKELAARRDRLAVFSSALIITVEKHKTGFRW